ncbi:MAG: hypothetical protein EBU90_04295 [Proteobacteria bacterium]|nr:hypothetical protein [Pseudomonadota bacterium]
MTTTTTTHQTKFTKSCNNKQKTKISGSTLTKNKKTTHSLPPPSSIFILLYTIGFSSFDFGMNETMYETMGIYHEE